MTVNVVAMAIVFMGAAIFGENVLTSVQILWVNLIMDTFAALALATESPSESMLDRMPHSRNAKIINSVMWRNIFGQTFYQVIVVLVTLIWGREILGYEYPSDIGMYMTAQYLANNPSFEGVIAIGDPTPKLHVYTVAF
jgi:magnesium-transporting ATPase (P-type)